MTPLLYYYKSLSPCTHWAILCLDPSKDPFLTQHSDLDIAVHEIPGIWRWRGTEGPRRNEATCWDARVYTTLALIKMSSTYVQLGHMPVQAVDQGLEGKHCIDYHSSSPPPSLVLFFSAREHTNYVLMCKNSAKSFHSVIFSNFSSINAEREGKQGFLLQLVPWGTFAEGFYYNTIANHAYDDVHKLRVGWSSIYHVCAQEIPLQSITHMQ